MESRSTQVAVIGGGPGGYAAAFRAADLGLQTTLIDPEANPGGVCLYRGCIPSKALLQVAKVIREARDATAWGVDFGQPEIDLAKLRTWKNDVVSKLTGGLGTLCRSRKVAYVQGRARLQDGHTLRLAADDGTEQALTFEHAILATGSRPAIVQSLSLESPRVLDSTTALEFERIPDSLLVVGGGYIGLELATVYAALGSRVTVVEMTKSLLPGADRDLAKHLTRELERQFAAVHLATTVAGLRQEGRGLRVTLEGATTPAREQDFDRALVSVGRIPNTGGLGLDQTQVRIDDGGFIQVDSQRRTAEPSIYAIGDVVGHPMLAHKATHEGLTAAEAIAGHNVAFEPQAIPAVVFTDPEAAWCGVTEADAKTAKQKVKVARFPWSASGRAATLGRAEGLTKLLIEPETERLLGAGIVGPGAGDLIAEAALAIEMGATARDLALTVHPHPTLSETLMEAAEVYFGQSVHLYRPR